MFASWIEPGACCWLLSCALTRECTAFECMGSKRGKDSSVIPIEHVKLRLYMGLEPKKDRKGHWWNSIAGRSSRNSFLVECGALTGDSSFVRSYACDFESHPYYRRPMRQPGEGKSFHIKVGYEFRQFI